MRDVPFAICLSLGLSSAASLPTVAAADVFVSNAGGPGDFFNPTSWTNLTGPELFPGQSSQASLAMADGSIITIRLDDPLFPPSYLNDFNIGSNDFSVFGAPVDPTTEGTFIIDGGVGGGSFDQARFVVGVADGNQQSASGTLTTINADIGTGGGFPTSLRVGINSSDDPTSTATGVAIIDGVFNGSSVNVGQTLGPTGSATGTLTSERLSASNDLSVGYARVEDFANVGDGSGNAQGTVTVTSGDARVNLLNVGEASGADAVADGLLEIQHGDLVVTTQSEVFASRVIVGQSAPSFFFDGAGQATGRITADAMYSDIAGDARAISNLVIGRATGGGTADGRVIAPEDNNQRLLFENRQLRDTFIRIGDASSGGKAYGEFIIGNTLEALDDDPFQGFPSYLYVGQYGGDSASATPGEGVGKATVGGLIGFGGILVGNSSAGLHEGLADGSVTVGPEGFTGTGSRFNSLFAVGTASGAADAQGELIFNGDVFTNGLSSFQVGAVGQNFFFDNPVQDNNGNAFPVGDAIGRLVFRDASLSTLTPDEPGGAIYVGRANVAGNQSVTVDGTFEFGKSSGSRQSLDFGSIVLGQVSADDASIAQVTADADIQNADVDLTFGMTIGSAFGSFGGSDVNVQAAMTITDSTVTIGNDNFSGGISIGTGALSLFGHQVMGKLDLKNSTVTATGGITVGENQEEGRAGDGILELEGSFASLGTFLRVGSESTIVFHIDGFERGKGYGAIDVAGTAFLGGTALIDFGTGFDFASATDYAFDLLMADVFESNKFFPEDFENEFDSVLFKGLADGYFAFASYVEEDGKDIFRVNVSTQIAPVPLPASIWLAGFGFVALGLVGRRKQRTRVEP